MAKLGHDERCRLPEERLKAAARVFAGFARHPAQPSSMSLPRPRVQAEADFAFFDHFLRAFQTQATLENGLFYSGGEGGIRTHEPREGSPVFKTGAINRSATSPFGPAARGLYG